MAMDITWGGAPMDLMSPEGFLGAVYNVCRLTPGSGCLAAPVCSSFAYMCFGKNCLKKHLGILPTCNYDLYGL